MINGFKITKYCIVAFCMVYSFTSSLYAQEKDESVINEFNGVGNRDILSRIAPIGSIVPIDPLDPIDPVDPINIPSINCNLLPSTVDGSFQSCVGVSSNTYNGNVTCGGWQIVGQNSPDTWNIPIPSTTYLNRNMVESPDGGSFAGGIAKYLGIGPPNIPEEFNTTITDLIPGTQYQIKFYQSNLTNLDNSRILGSVRWEVTFGNEIQTSGNAIVQQSPTWSEQSLTFTATTAIQNLIFTAVEGTIIGNYDYLYAVIDGIKIIRTNFDCNAPCTPIVGKIKIVSTPIPTTCQANVIATPTSQTISSGQTTGISLTSTVVGTTFKWTVEQAGVSGAMAGSGSFIEQVLLNTGTATYTIIPTLGNCSGTPIKVVISVNEPSTEQGYEYIVYPGSGFNQHYIRFIATDGFESSISLSSNDGASTICAKSIIEDNGEGNTTATGNICN